MKHLATPSTTALLLVLAATCASAQSYGTGWKKIAGGADVTWKEGDTSEFAGSLKLGAGVYSRDGSKGYAAEGYLTGTVYAFGEQGQLVHLSARADTVSGANVQFRLFGLSFANLQQNEITWSKSYIMQFFKFKRTYAVGPIPVTFAADAGILTQFGLSLGIEDGVYLKGSGYAGGYISASAIAGGSYQGCGAEAGVEATISILGTSLTPKVTLKYDGTIQKSMMLEVFGIRIQARLFAWAGCWFIKASWEQEILDETYGGLANRNLLP